MTTSNYTVYSSYISEINFYEVMALETKYQDVYLSLLKACVHYDDQSIHNCLTALNLPDILWTFFHQ